MSRRFEPTCFVSSDKKLFHRIGEVGMLDDAMYFMTACGKSVNTTWGINSIDRKRAELLGRPCRRCFPMREVS